MLAPLALENFLGGVPWVICQVEEDTTLCDFILVWFRSSQRAAFIKCACSCDALRDCGYQKITLILADKQPSIKLFHVEVNVILFATKRLDPKDVPGH